MLALLVTALAVAATPTLEVTPRHLNQEGVRATYTRSVDVDGTVHLRGRYDDRSRTPFHFKIKEPQVRGEVNGVLILFTRPDRF